MALVALVTLMSAAGLEAQPKGRPHPAFTTPDPLSTAEGMAYLESVRRASLPGPYSFRFALTHYPRQGATETHEGVLWGYGGAAGQTLRVHLHAPSGERRWLLRNGPDPIAWQLKAGAEGATCVPLDSAALHEPLLAGTPMTPFTLLTPYLWWPDTVYEGPTRTKARPVQQFLAYPPEDQTGPATPAAVRLHVDDQFQAIVRAEYLDASGEPYLRLSVQSVKKHEDQWIVRTIELLDLDARTKTRFDVEAVALPTPLAEGWLDPARLGEGLPAGMIPAYERL